MLNLSFKLGETLWVFHKGESYKATIVERRGETCLEIDAPQSFQFVRGSARVKHIPPSPHLSERVRARLRVIGGRDQR